MLNSAQLSRADLNLLVLFQAVLEERHVGRAAARLALTASAVSHGLGRLRRLLDDPLFLRTPRGVIPTERATALAAPIAEILERVSHVLATAARFDPARVRRRFTIAAPDAVAAVFVAPLLAELAGSAPGVDISVTQLLPTQPGPDPLDAWSTSLAALESGRCDLAVLPMPKLPARFAARPLFEEHFVVVMRRGHPFARRPTLERYCAQRHLLVSHSGDAQGIVDLRLARAGKTRRVVLTVPSFMLALTVVATTDLIAAVPLSLARRHAARHGLVVAELPLTPRSDPMQLVALRGALADPGVAWLYERLAASFETTSAARKVSSKQRLLRSRP